MIQPKYNVSNSVYYSTLNSYGHVASIINLNDQSDVRKQGYRYEIKIAGLLYSTPEYRLFTHKKNTSLPPAGRQHTKDTLTIAADDIVLYRPLQMTGTVLKIEKDGRIRLALHGCTSGGAITYLVFPKSVTKS